MALAGAPDGHVAVDTAVTAATLQTASSVWLVQFPAEFDLSRLTGSKLKLRSAPNGAGELLSGKLTDGARVSFVAEDPSLAAQLFVVAAPSSGAVQVQHRLTALVQQKRDADGDADAPEDGAGGAAPATEEAEAPVAAAPEEERPKKKKRKDREDGEPRKEKHGKEKKSRKEQS